MAVDLSPPGAVFTVAGETSQPALALPPLREDLKLLPGPSANNGSPTWTLQDPARHRFIRIGWLEFEILARWGLGDAAAIAAAVSSETTLRAGVNDVAEVLQFLHRAGLLAPRGDAAIARFMAETDGRRLSAPRWLLKNYLSIKFRLVSPDRFLGAAVVHLGWVFTRGFAVALACLAALGFYLIGRQWSAYTHSLLHLFSLQGALMVGIALASAKVIHELGHGLMCKRLGCRVPAMGVALLVLWPVLWTDTTDAWRLTERRQRLAIDAAGMLAEITLAIVASLAWSVLPDGALRTGAFLLSSSTWLLTLAVNLNPLMRFDGYFIFSDYLEVPNLQERGLAMGRWWLRETLFGLGDPAPEYFPRGKRRVLIAWSIASMIYRFSLFLGIALVVYHMAFKALGLFLMCVEIGWFLARPIIGELVIWLRRLRAGRPSPRATITFGVLAVALLLLIVPWRHEVEAPALLRAARQTTLYAAEPGRVVELPRNGSPVAAGDALYVLASPAVAYHQAVAAAALAGVEARMKGQSFNPDESSMIGVGQQELEGALASLDDAASQEALLTVRAPFAGTVTDVPMTLRRGEWLPRREALGVLIDSSTQVVEAYIGESDLGRVHPGASARFYPENGDAPVELRVASIGSASVRTLDVQDLASVYGGGVAVRKDGEGKLVPESAIYRATLVPARASVPIVKRLRGTVTIDADRSGLLSRIYRRAVALVIRESEL
jgi:putative peptide zinc metalloprotease protein